MKKISSPFILTLIFLSGCGSVWNEAWESGFVTNKSNNSFMLSGSFLMHPERADFKAKKICGERGFNNSSLIDDVKEFDGAWRKTYQCSNPPTQTYQPPQPVYVPPPQIVPPPQAPTISLDAAKKKCADLGFKAGTEAFGNCVLRLSK